MLKWIKSLLGRNQPQTTTLNIHVDCDELMRRGYALQEAGKLDEAKKIYETILEHQVTYTDALYFLGIIHDIQGEKKRAIALIEAAIATNNQVPDFYKILGHLHSALKNHQQAAQAFEKAIALETADVTTLTSLANSYRELAAFGKSLERYSQAIEIAPDCWPAIHSRAEIYLHCGHVMKALEDHKNAYTIKPDEAPAFRCYLFALNFATHLSALEIFNEHKRYDEHFGAGKYGNRTRSIHNPLPDRNLRIGYISPDFHFHAVSFFIGPILENHDKQQFEVFCYHIDNLKDNTTKKLMSLSDHWRDCFELSSEAIAEQIIADRIDILVDLAGHTSNNRLEIFSQKPAPIQITWLGYLNTTGLSTMDYRITDQYSDAPGVSEHLHTEKLIRLPHSQWCFNKPTQEIQISELPALSAQGICFGSFNRYSKLSEKILKLWVRLLHEIAESRLLLIDVPDCEHDSIIDFFVMSGIYEERLELYPRSPIDFFRKLHHRVDIALDSHPYSGGTTTCESLWMGVPTLTLIGETSISKSTSSLMQTLGLEDWIAYNEEEFIAVAKQHTSNLEKLGELRMGLREKLESSPIMDAVQFTNDLEKAYRDVWVNRCSELSQIE